MRKDAVMNMADRFLPAFDASRFDTNGEGRFVMDRPRFEMDKQREMIGIGFVPEPEARRSVRRSIVREPANRSRPAAR